MVGAGSPLFWNFQRLRNVTSFMTWSGVIRNIASLLIKSRSVLEMSPYVSVSVKVLK